MPQFSGDCRLTGKGKEVIEDYVGKIREGGTITMLWPKQEKAGFEVAGEGDSRLVLREADDAPEPLFSGSRDCVVKVAKFPDPWQNRNEIINWTFSPPAVRELLAPIHQTADDGLWIVMPEATELDVGTNPSAVLDPMEDAGYALADVRSDHIGLIDGVPKLVDYGHRIETLDGERVAPDDEDFEAARDYGFYARKERGEL